PEAIDHRRRVSACGHLAAHFELVLLVVDPPGQVVNGADAPGAPPLAGSLGEVDPGPGAAVADRPALPAPLGTEPAESEGGREKVRGRRELALAQARPVEAADLMPRLDRAPLPGGERPCEGRRTLDQGQRQAVWVAQDRKAHVCTPVT